MRVGFACLLVGLFRGDAFGRSRGDLTGDGKVDGVDALKIMRIVCGLEEGTEEDLYLGDVHPIPGEGGKVIGDGKLPRDDALQLLKYSVGLLSSGEAPGDSEETVA